MVFVWIMYYSVIFGPWLLLDLPSGPLSVRLCSDHILHAFVQMLTEQSKTTQTTKLKQAWFLQGQWATLSFKLRDKPQARLQYKDEGRGRCWYVSLINFPHEVLIGPHPRVDRDAWHKLGWPCHGEEARKVRGEFHGCRESSSGGGGHVCRPRARSLKHVEERPGCHQRAHVP